MTAVQTSARLRAKPIRLVDADALIAGLTRLAKHQVNGGFVSRAGGVRSAIEYIKRDLAVKPGRSLPE